MHTEILVIGGGVVGSACALRLAEQGHEVTLLDPEEPERAASFGNAGHIATEQIYPLASPATLATGIGYLLQTNAPLSVRAAYWPSILGWMMRFAWAARPRGFAAGTRALASLQAGALPALATLLETAEASNLLQTRGHILAFEHSDGAFAQTLAACHRDGIPVRIAGSDAAGDLAGRAQRFIEFTRSAHVTSPAAVVEAFKAAFGHAGGHLYRAEALAITSQPRGYAIDTGAQRIVARKIILAAGAWSARLLQPLGIQVPLETERGYHLHLPNWRPAQPCPVAFHERKIILTPMRDGTRISGFVEFGGLKARPDPARFRALEMHVRAIAPLADMTGVRRWMGFRPSLPDHLPAIGPLSARHPGLICAFGHQHLGLTLSAVTADIVAGVCAGRPPAIDLRPFRPARFTRHRAGQTVT